MSIVPGEEHEKARKSTALYPTACHEAMSYVGLAVANSSIS